MQEYPEINNSNSSFARFLGGIFSGIIAGGLLALAISAGLKNNYFEEQPLEYWGILYWGDHYIIRLFWSLVGTGWGAFISGLIARRRGALIGCLSSIPTVLLWLGVFYIWAFAEDLLFDSGFDSPVFGNKVISILIPLLSLIVAYNLGLIGQQIAQKYSEHFDKKKSTILGIKWYHYIWIIIPLYSIILQTAWVIYYGLEWVIISFSEGFGLLGTISSLFLLAIGYTLMITGKGLSLAYDFLSDYSQQYTRKETVIGVLKYGIGYPIFAALLQSLLSLLSYGIGLLFS